MRPSARIILVAVSMCLYLAHPVWSAPTSNKTKVILVSMDGFRYDYLDKIDTPNFDRMIKSGVTMPFMNNTFVTLTFPCHYTMVTGRYEESHGIIANHMYDPTFDDYFSFTTTESRWWDEAEPVWITAKKAGLKTGVFFWPGSEAELLGPSPDEVRAYDGTVPYETRVETVLKWMADDDFDLGLLYFDEPDHTGHTYGPDGHETIQMVAHMDSILGLILDGIEDKGLNDTVNLIVTSDHGMANVDTLHRLIDVSVYANSSLLLEVVEQGTTAHIRPQPGKAKELVEALSNVEHMTVMLKEDIPEHFHFKDHRRVMPVFAMADDGWQITGNATSRKYYPFLGDHGYDNDFLSMKPIFVATGPAFKSGQKVESIKSVDIYPLICHLLNMDPAPNNGSLDRASSLLRRRGDNSDKDGNGANSDKDGKGANSKKDGNGAPFVELQGFLLFISLLMSFVLLHS